MAVDFSGPNLKTERAEHHITQLERLFGQYVRENRKAIQAQTYKYNRHQPVKLGARFPRHTPTVLGDAIHNLRASLDHAYCLLVKDAGGTTNRHTTFPLHRDAQSMAGSIDGQIGARQGPSVAVRDCIINRIQPYEGGKGERLYGLHKLDITDKHEVLIPVRREVDLSGYLITLPGGFKAIGGRLIAMNDEMDSLISMPGARFEPKHDVKGPVDICFQQGQPFQGQSIVQTMRDLLILTRSTLELLRTAR